MLPPVAVRVAICALVWEKWINRPPGTLFDLLGAIWQNSPSPADRECRAAKMGENGDGWQGRNVCRLKGLCCFRSLNPKKHRPAKPCGKVKVHTFSRDTGIFDACFLKKGRNSGNFGKGK